ncbi:MAG: hypothetical protein KF729_36935 [Sandaracinaceae bacterium]|nr:hypothetical protein [Sandaracinaceae bacterium]
MQPSRVYARLSLLGLTLLAGCDSEGGADGGAARDAAMSLDAAGADAAPTDGARPPQDAARPDGGDTDASTPPPGGACAPLPAPSGMVISVGPRDDLAAAMASAPAGATVSLADGTYDVPAAGLWVRADDVTVRGASGDRARVVLDGGYRQTSGGVLNVYGRRGVTIAHLTIRRARYHAVHVTGGPTGPSDRARLYDLHVADPGEQAIKINSNDGNDNDDGEIACSLIELTDEGRAVVMSHTSSGSRCYTGGVDAHRARGWAIRDNVIRGFWCDNGDLSEHGIHFWRGGRDTLVERNLLVDNARGIGFGLGMPGPGRTYDDAPCAGIASAEHYRGVIRNNVVLGLRDALFDSPSGMDLGIGLESACDAVVVHNTVASLRAPFSSIEWRWPASRARVINNLATGRLRPRDGASAEQTTNLENASAGTFEDLAGASARLAAGAADALGRGDAEGVTLAPTDFAGETRGNPPDLGALER